MSRAAHVVAALQLLRKQQTCCCFCPALLRSMQSLAHLRPVTVVRQTTSVAATATATATARRTRAVAAAATPGTTTRAALRLGTVPPPRGCTNFHSTTSLAVSRSTHTTATTFAAAATTNGRFSSSSRTGSRSSNLIGSGSGRGLRRSRHRALAHSASSRRRVVSMGLGGYTTGLVAAIASAGTKAHFACTRLLCRQ